MSDTIQRKGAQHSTKFRRDAPSDLRPLDDRHLVRLWRSLPSELRLPFLLALDEQIADRMFLLTMPSNERGS
jgi:hypothetical protein